MRYTERETGHGEEEVETKGDLIKSFIVRLPFAIPRLTNEVTKKIVFMEKEQVMKLFRTSLIMNVLLMIPDVVKTVKFGFDGVTPITFSKVISLVAIGTATFAYTESIADIEKLKRRAGKKRKVVKETEVVEEVENDEDDLIIIEENGNEFNVSKMPEEDTEYVELSRDILAGGEYPSPMFDGLMDEDLSFAVKESYSTERAFNEVSAEETVDEILDEMYSSGSSEFKKEDEVLSFDDLSEMLGL